MKVKVGPISAEFQGVADITRDEATRTGTIMGSGKDKRSNSATRGLVGYAVKQGDNPNETQVDVSIGFTLTGALAQFSRSGLVQDVAGRLIAMFGQESRGEALRQYRAIQGEAPGLDAASLVLDVLKGQAQAPVRAAIWIPLKRRDR